MAVTKERWRQMEIEPTIVHPPHNPLATLTRDWNSRSRRLGLPPRRSLLLLLCIESLHLSKIRIRRVLQNRRETEAGVSGDGVGLTARVRRLPL